LKSARAWAWAVVLAYASLIFYLSSLSHPAPWLTRHVWDKALHTTEYAGLGFLLALALAETARLRPLALLFAAAGLATLYGATDEFHQHFVPGRTADWHDLLADCIGGTTGALLGISVHARVLASKNRSRPSGEGA
jgi:VanZ family protein